MNNKPSICRLSPLGKSRGLKTGRLTFEYKESIDDCPACNSNVKIKVSDYLSSVETHSEIKQEEQIHKIYMHMDATPLKPKERLRFHEIVKKIYNIDKLLFDYGLGTEHRPNMDQLIKIVFAAGKGDFSLYEQFIDKLKNIKKALNGVENENKKTPLNLGRYT